MGLFSKIFQNFVSSIKSFIRPESDGSMIVGVQYDDQAEAIQRAQELIQSTQAQVSQYNSKVQELVSKIQSDADAAYTADYAYQRLDARGLHNNPAYSKYDGPYYEQVQSLMSQASGMEIDVAVDDNNVEAISQQLQSYQNQLQSIAAQGAGLATRIQNFLHEPTANYDAAREFEANFNSGLNFSGIDKGSEFYSKVIDAFHSFYLESSGASVAYGSERLINEVINYMETDPSENLSKQDIMTMMFNKVSNKPYTAYGIGDRTGEDYNGLRVPYANTADMDLNF